MDIYSLVLFHLKREVAASALAQSLLALEPQAPQAHVAAGNAFALQRETSVALRCFRRAINLDQGYAYAYTLAGYESLDLGQSERAVGFFRSALRCDRRHWNAW